MAVRKILLTSDSNIMGNPEPSASFFLLHEKIRRWVWSQGWTELREAQEAAIAPILKGEQDVIIAATTASGKTEAAFLPICSKLLELDHADSCVIYVSPLKALINDQFNRMEQLCEQLAISVCPWHGDISASKKKKFIEEHKGILLITPESLESLFVNHGYSIPGMLSRTAYIVVDELHSFIGSERGCQLQSLLRRLEVTIKRNVPRIGLSATLGDMYLAADYLRPLNSQKVELIISKATGQEIKLLLRGYLEKEPLRDIESENTIIKSQAQHEYASDGSIYAISDSVYESLRGTSNLIFANSRARVETFADLLRRKCETNRVPNEFWPHHGSLSKELREDAEAAIKDKSRPVNVVCTSTLEMGIDIGAVNSIAQIGAPPSVASMRQRLGRSGRRGNPAILRIYIQEQEIEKNTPPSDALRSELVQSIAMVRLLIDKWNEPPRKSGLHLSTMIQQIMSTIAQYGGVTAPQLRQLLCDKGPFSSVDRKTLIDLLRDMGENKLIAQSSDGLLLHGSIGERIVNHYSFYTAFMTQEEYRLVSGNRTLGTLPIDRPVSEGSLLIFGGTRWSVISVDLQKKVIELIPAGGGKAPIFGGQAGTVHDRIRQEMFAVYTEEQLPLFLDKQAIELLREARSNFKRMDLANNAIIRDGNNSLIFCWMGDVVMDTVTVLLHSHKLKASNDGIAVTVLDITPSDLVGEIRSILSSGIIDAIELARVVTNKACEKYDQYLSDNLLCQDYASSRLDVSGALQCLNKIKAIGPSL